MYVSFESKYVSFEGRYVSYTSVQGIYDNVCMTFLKAYIFVLNVHICRSLLRANMATYV